jgi:hypothetical protein
MCSKVKFICPQNVLEKFEFFPIKCRVQRSLESFTRTWNGSQPSKIRKAQWNQKVRSYYNMHALMLTF